MMYMYFSVIVLFALTATVLQGCGGGDKEKIDQLKAQVSALEKSTQESCANKCEFDSRYGRWHSLKNGFMCWDEETKMAVCECTDSEVQPESCKALPDSGASLASLDENATIVVNGKKSQESKEVRLHTRAGRGHSSGTLALDVSTDGAEAGSAALQLQNDMSASFMTKAGGSPRETVTNFCDPAGLAAMHGQAATTEREESDPSHNLESKILGDVAHELETNNVDKMAKEIFTFYVCARWAPDATFWTLAEQELTAQFADEQLSEQDSSNTGKAIADMYKSYKFVPMLCSRNLEVFRETDSVDKTYFGKFKAEVAELSDWIKDAGSSVVGQALSNIDRSFCGDSSMDSCDRSKILEAICPKFLCGKSTAEMWDDLVTKIRSFGKQTGEDPAWDSEFSRWKERLPYHSFIAKPQGWQSDSANSPRATQRYVVCFGKRVASELHRRPNGRHILTDQNNIGCHGWYEDREASAQLQRMIELWKPPTCQLAEMTYTMKKEIMKKFQQMNERLFDALPSMINDELEEQQGEDGYTWEQGLPKPFSRTSFTDRQSSKVFVDTMKVSAQIDICIQADGDGSCKSGFKVKKGDVGEVKVTDGGLGVVWETTSLAAEAKGRSWPVEASQIQILPYAWKAKKGFHAHVKDLVAGVSHITDQAKAFFASMFVSRQKNLADLMSGSVSKWAVCPIKDTADLEELDSHLGVEDAAFQDFQKEAYKSWTGYENEVPGEKCVAAKDVLDSTAGFEDAHACEISELHADHVEKYTKNRATLETEQFICPLRPPLQADVQLAVLSEKAGTCFLRMTGRQEQHYGWHYQGLFPARRQNDRKANIPNTEYELVKLLEAPSGGPQGEATFGRYCSVEELRAQPRFCNLAKVRNHWGKVSDLVDSITESLTGVPGLGDTQEALAPLGIGATAIASTVARYQAFMKKNASDKVKDVAIAVGEKGWDGLRGASRLMRSSAVWVKDHVTGELPGAGRMSVELDASLFGHDSNGEVLHSLSFQRTIGANGATSNAKERFQRYVMSVPCPNFDPVFEYGMRKRWGKVALQMVHEAYRVRGHESSGLLSHPSIHLVMRGEGLRFKKTREKTVSVITKTTAAMIWNDAGHGNGQAGRPPTCEHTGFQKCEPAQLCESKWSLSFDATKCVPKPWWKSIESGGWWPVTDTKLVEVLAPVITAGTVDVQTQLFGLELFLYCAPKRAFGASGPPNTSAKTQSLLECLEAGVETNAALKAKEPWKLYFPDEVVVVASFKQVEERGCLLSTAGNADQDSKQALCTGASENPALASHLLDSNGQPFGGHSSDGEYMGVHAGAGFPKGTLEEVVMRPADVLEALGLLTPSNGR